jgi:CheY-like chemotaxis protein
MIMEEAKGPRNNRILVIDDNPSIHEDIRKILGSPREDHDLAGAKTLLFGEESVASDQTGF